MEKTPIFKKKKKKKMLMFLSCLNIFLLEIIKQNLVGKITCP